MATTSVKRRPQKRAQRKSGTRQPSNGETPAGPTKAATKPDHSPEKAERPKAASKSGEPHKAHKPEAASKSGEPHKARKPKAARQATQASPRGGGKSGNSPRRNSQSDGDGGVLEGVAEKAQEMGGPAGALVKAATPGGGGSSMQKLVLKVGKALAKRAAAKGADKLEEAAPSGGSEMVRQALSRGVGGLAQSEHRLLELASTSTEVRARRRPPIQCAVEAGVPAHVAWDEWMALAWLPEGVARVFEVQRRGKSRLRGRLDGGEGQKWSAKILDEREHDSFAWQSNGGTDCAGLITFHALGETLTRIEVNLDVVPKTLTQAAALSTRLADRRTQADLRRFKARLELISPDLYADDETQAG